MSNKGLLDIMASYFINRWGMREYRRGWLKGNCPECGKHDKFGINLHDNRSNCFSCNYNKPPLRVIESIENLKYSQGLQYLMDLKLKPIKLKAPKNEPIISREYIAPSLPKDFILLSMGKGKISELARSYIRGRGFSVDELSMKGWGYCKEGPYKYYIIIPFYSNGVITYFNARKFFGGGTKYKNPTIDEIGVGKNNILYNQDAIYIYNSIYLLEGAFNAEILGDSAIATSGKVLSSWQIDTIIKSPVDEIIIIQDRDALSITIQLAMTLIQDKRIKVVILPDGVDPNDLGKTKTLEIVNNTEWANFKSLIKLKNTLCE